MSRRLAAVLYLLVAGNGAFLLAALVALPFHGAARGLVFVEVALSAAAMAGALTPRRASAYIRKDGRP